MEPPTNPQVQIGPAASVGSLELNCGCVMQTGSLAAAASCDSERGLCVTVHTGTLALACGFTRCFQADICVAGQCMLIGLHQPAGAPVSRTLWLSSAH